MTACMSVVTLYVSDNASNLSLPFSLSEGRRGSFHRKAHLSGGCRLGFVKPGRRDDLVQLYVCLHDQRMEDWRPQAGPSHLWRLTNFQAQFMLSTQWKSFWLGTLIWHEGKLRSHHQASQFKENVSSGDVSDLHTHNFPGTCTQPQCSDDNLILELHNTPFCEISVGRASGRVYLTFLKKHESF